MPDGREDATEPLTVKIVSGMAEIAEADWDACAKSSAEPDDPFVCHAFLRALEDSGSVTAETGWRPQHLVAEDSRGRVVAVAPLYLKGHSYGEYVFDWGWADAFERAGGSYYPKLQSAVPFTPVTGRRILVRAGTPSGIADTLVGSLGQAMVQLASRLGVSSAHVTFPTKNQWNRLGEAGFLKRLGQQYHWRNPGYGCFDDFLATLSSRKRKNIRRERRQMAESGIRLRTLTGGDIDERHWRAFYGFYTDTSGRKWGGAYLNLDFFLRLGEALAGKVVLVLAYEGGGPDPAIVGGALNLLGGDTLYGRYWGCAAAYKFLHFEACYYRAMDFAIERGLSWVEAGAQGPHKIQRGYLPTPTYSAHWIADPSFRRAVEEFLTLERQETRHEMAALGRLSPFRKGPVAQGDKT